jgi:hypothetical protein
LLFNENSELCLRPRSPNADTQLVQYFPHWKSKQSTRKKFFSLSVRPVLDLESHLQNLLSVDVVSAHEQ